MSGFDLVLRGNIVLADNIFYDGYVAVSGEKVVAIGIDSAPAAREFA